MAKKFKVQVIVVAGGLGTRFKSSLPKSLVLLNGKPLAAHSLRVFNAHAGIDSVVLVGAKDYLLRFEKLADGFKKVKFLVAGGATRAQSVQCGLAVIDEDTDIVLVHDAARPLVDKSMVDRLLLALTTNKAAIVAVPVKATIKKVNKKTLMVEETPSRDLLWDVQTPQGFRKGVLLKAHAKPFKGEATDDAMLVEALGVKVKVVMGDYRNIKVTTPEDLHIAKGLI